MEIGKEYLYISEVVLLKGGESRATRKIRGERVIYTGMEGDWAVFLTKRAGEILLHKEDVALHIKEVK